MARVLDFGGPSLGPCFSALRLCFPERVHRLLALARNACENLEYEEFKGAVEDAERQLKEGELISVQMESVGDASTVGGIYSPGFCGETLQDWSASVEGGVVNESLFRQLLDVPGLSYVSLSRDESLDLDVAHVSSAVFPWEDWRIEIAAAKGSDGTWRVQERELKA